MTGMKRSTERFLTTHTGSLPRPADLIRMMFAKEEGVPVEAAALATRVRAAGSGGSGNTFMYQDLADFPSLEKRVFGDPGRSRRKTPACNAPIAVRDREAAAVDIADLKAALAAAGRPDAFMSA